MRILLVEDDNKLCVFAASQLRKEDYIVDTCIDGESAMFYTGKQLYDLIILDRMLPEIDGITILELMRKKGIKTPVIMTTAMVGINDRIDGLDAGADDYLTKPYSMDELLARIRALLRRPQELKAYDELVYQELTLSLQSKVLSYRGESCELSQKELQLMEFFLKNPGRILERDLILSRVWGPDAFASESNLDTYISFLRRRLKNIHSSILIKTIRSVGYRLEKSSCFED